jgi:hypothetical protein
MGDDWCRHAADAVQLPSLRCTTIADVWAHSAPATPAKSMLRGNSNHRKRRNSNMAAV